MLMTILLGLALAAALLAGFIATRPPTFRVERAIAIAAPAELVFSWLNDFRQWGAWSPWDVGGPALKKTFAGPVAGVGASLTWAVEGETGEGKATIVESRADEAVRVALEFDAPFAAATEATLALAPAGAGVTLTWTMTGRNLWAGKALSLFVDLDAMVGSDFETGLARLKRVAEADVKMREGLARAATAPASAPAVATP